eukprot:scaffold2418_cov175-Amphora_coffeaeformis.AAC.7
MMGMITRGAAVLLCVSPDTFASGCLGFHDTCAATAFQRSHHRQGLLLFSSAESSASFENFSRGKKKQYVETSVRQENRIAALEDLSSRTAAEKAELNGLYLRSAVFEEQYDAALFSQEHTDFKLHHNQAFGKLVQYIQNKSSSAQPVNVFFLDGPDAATTTSLLQVDGTDISQMFVANRHESTCQVLRKRYWEGHPKNVVHSSAANALRDEFRDLSFGAYYFDGCGGHVPRVLEMVKAVFSQTSTTSACQKMSHRPMVIGFSLLGGGRDIVDKESTIIQALVKMAKKTNLQVRHVFDDPRHFGVDSSLSKIQGGTFTSWVVLEPYSQ